MRFFAVLICLSIFVFGCFSKLAAQNTTLKVSEKEVQPPTYNYRLPAESTGFYTAIDFLLWKVNENGKDFVIKRTDPINATIGSGLLGSFHEAEFEWQPGVRPLIGYQFKPDFWKIEGLYTFYQTGKTTNVNQPEANDPALESLNTTLNGYLGNATASARSSTNFIYNSGDLSLKKQYQISPYAYLTLQMGVKGIWVHQHWHVDYKDVLNNVGKHRQHWKYHGVGPQLGLETEWYLGKGFSLEAMASSAFLYGNKTHKQKYTLFLVDSSINGVFPFQDFDLSRHTTLPTTQFKMSIRWGRTFMDSLEFNLYAGYEINGIYNANEDYRFISDVNPIDEKAHTYSQTSVFMQGLFAGIKMHF